MNRRAIDGHLAALFRNGKAETGLEVGTDVGLAENEYIRIPRCMVKRWCARVADKDLVGYLASHPYPDGVTSVADWDEHSSPRDFAQTHGWISTGSITITGGIKSALIGGEAFELSEFHIEPFTADDVAKFVTVNTGHIRDDDFSEDTRAWIHAVRFWSVVGGLVTVAKNREFVIVDDPDDEDEDAEHMLDFIIAFSANSWTACAARAGTWRKTGHCTGGDMAVGFARSWLSKEGFMYTSGDQATRGTHRRLMTSAFYIATHATSVHAALALNASGDEYHWATIDPSHGFFWEWTAHESARIRLEPKDQIAGAAMVVDSVTVLKDVVRENLAPLLTHIDQHTALIDAYKEVCEHGIACATYAQWFLDGHPAGYEKRRFNQKDTSYAALIGELAVVATLYYSGSTIADSMSLKNAAQQLGTPGARDTWAQLGRNKQALSAQQATQAYARIKGASATGLINNLLSRDEDEVGVAVDAYNGVTASVAGALGFTSVPQIRKETIIANAEAADAAAAQMGGD
jgi:hypothetical protein